MVNVQQQAHSRHRQTAIIICGATLATVRAIVAKLRSDYGYNGSNSGKWFLVDLQFLYIWRLRKSLQHPILQDWARQDPARIEKFISPFSLHLCWTLARTKEE